MHDDQLDIDDETVRRLVGEQFPQWRDEAITRVPGSGTVNAIFRIGDGLAARFPLRGGDADTWSWLRTEAAAMNELAECASVPVPIPVAIGRPGAPYPLHWSVQTWLEGEIATPSGLADSAEFARDLGGFIASLRTVDTRGRRFAGKGRGGDLQAQDAWMAECIPKSRDLFDAERTAALWAGLRALPRTEPDAMVHGDLIPGNVLVREGRLAGILDGGGFGPADPALELVGAWHMLDSERRGLLRETLGSDDLEWARGAAWAFAQAMGLGGYYRESNPVMSALGLSTVGRILADAEIAGLARD